MTIEEAIKGLKSLVEVRRKYCAMQTMKDEIECLCMAIKALEREPCDDCISRQAVLEYVEGSEAELGHSSENELVCQDIKDFPSATPQPKTGHWIMTDDTNWYDAYFKCSCCGREIGIPYDLRNQVINIYPYCHCGAKMIEPQESEGEEYKAESEE